MVPDMDAPRNPPDGLPCAGAKVAEGSPPVLDSRVLLGPHAEVLIRHEGRVYRLRRTRLGKLILTA